LINYGLICITSFIYKNTEVIFRFLMRITETIQIIPISRRVLYPGIDGETPDSGFFISK